MPTAVVHAIMQAECQKPGCSNVSLNTYTGPHGNELQLCDRCYYEHVTGGTVPTFDTGVRSDLDGRPAEELLDELGSAEPVTKVTGGIDIADRRPQNGEMPQ